MRLARAVPCVVLLTCFVAFGRAGAQACSGCVPQPGKYPLLILQLPASTRMLALGDAGVAGRDDDVLFYDPAQLAIARGTSASFERYGGSADGGALSSVVRFASGGVAVGMSTVNFAEPGLYPVDRSQMTASGPTSGSSTVASVGLGQTFDHLHVGLSAKYAEDQIATARVDRVLADAGVSHDENWFGGNYTAAIAVQNIGGSPPGRNSFNDPLESPLRGAIGIAGGGPVGQLDLATAAQVGVRRDGWLKPAGGLELGYSWIEGYSFALRVGARRPEPGEQTLTAGAGLNGDRLSIDYALETLSGSRVAHRVGLRIR